MVSCKMISTSTKTNFLRGSISFLLLLYVSNINAQPYGMGCRIDTALYNKLPVVKEQTMRVSLPTAYSLERYCPMAKSQGAYETCVGWATAYAARTIVEAIKNNWYDKKTITNEAFSPAFTYSLIKGKEDEDCQDGSPIIEGLISLTRYGTPKYSLFHPLCATNISSDLFAKANANKLDHFSRLWSWNYTPYQKIHAVMTSLSKDRPVVIGMGVPESFKTSKEACWHPLSGEIVQGLHAMCVVAYDNDLYGGAFLIMNSWGEDWSKDGFKWITYKDFTKYVFEAYEVYMDIPIPNKNFFSGEVEFTSRGGEYMSLYRMKGKKICTYKLTETYDRGNHYRVYISNNGPSYVYMITSDPNNNTNILFPEENTNAELCYNENHIAIPDDSKVLCMGDYDGIDYICIIYSRKELDIQSLIRQVHNAPGEFEDKIAQSLAGILSSMNQLIFQDNIANFKTFSESFVVPMIFEIQHK